MADTSTGFELLPADEAIEPTPDEAIEAAAASALEDPDAPAEAAGDEQDPLGYSWLFDFEARRMVRQGKAPAVVFGVDALKQRCLMALYSARFAHAVFTENFGMSGPVEPIGEAGTDAEMAAHDWRVNAREALLAVDHVADAELDVEYNPVEGAIYVTNLVVTTNEEVELALDDLAIGVNDS